MDEKELNLTQRIENLRWLAKSMKKAADSLVCKAEAVLKTVEEIQEVAKEMYQDEPKEADSPDVPEVQEGEGGEGQAVVGEPVDPSET
jgi:hypothetical protein